MVVKSSEDQRQANQQVNRLPYESLEEVHIFVLSNILKRPIIVLGEPVVRSIHGHSLAPNNFVGIYLPLLWKTKECFKSPIVLGFTSNHFVPLVAMEDDLDLTGVTLTTEAAVPLVTSDLTFINVHFLMSNEEARVNGIIQEYMNIKEVPVTQRSCVSFVLCAKLTIAKLPDKYNLMIDFVQAAERVITGQEPIVQNPNDLSDTEMLLNQTRRDPIENSESHVSSRYSQRNNLNQPHGKTSLSDPINFNTERENRLHGFDKHINGLERLEHSPGMHQTSNQGQRSRIPVQIPREYPTVQCKTTGCTFFGTEATGGFCSKCALEHSRRNTTGTKMYDSLAFGVRP